MRWVVGNMNLPQWEVVMMRWAGHGAHRCLSRNGKSSAHGPARPTSDLEAKHLTIIMIQHRTLACQCAPANSHDIVYRCTTFIQQQASGFSCPSIEPRCCC